MHIDIVMLESWPSSSEICYIFPVQNAYFKSLSTSLILYLNKLLFIIYTQLYLNL